MPVQVEWDNDSRSVIRQIYSGFVTLDDYMRATDQVAEMVGKVAHEVHSIMDRTAITSAPSTALPALLYANRKLPDNIGLRLIINPSMYTRMIVNIGRHVAPRVITNVYFARDIVEARAIIRDHMAVAGRGESK